MSSILKLDDLTPADYGFDHTRYPSYRPVQLEALEMAMWAEKRFVGLGLPTGVGKSILALTLHFATGLRTCVLTATKGLQSQYSSADGRVVDVRGMANYTCGDRGVQRHRAVNGPPLDCKVGQRLGCKCPVDGRGGSYGHARRLAQDALLVSTNYDYWLAMNRNGRGLDGGLNGPVELLICDEADLAPGKLASFLGFRLTQAQVSQWTETDGLGDGWKEWREVAVEGMQKVGRLVDGLKMEMEYLGMKGELGKVVELSHEVEKMGRTSDQLAMVGGMEEGEWVIEKTESSRWGSSWSFDVIWPGRYAEKYLFVGVPRVVLMSATLRPKTMAHLGIQKDEYEFREWRRIFQPARGPILHLPAVKVVPTKDGPKEVMVNLNHRVGDVDLALWVEQIDSWIDEWQKFKGLIHTVSYDRQAYLMSHSRHRRLMVGNTQEPDSPNAWKMYEKFLKQKVGVLVSPSFSTGWDFKGEAARWQIVAKVPFVPRHGKLMKARLARDGQYADHLTMQELIQSCGRIQRSDEDWGVTVIMDGSLAFFMMRNKGLGAGWFGQAVRRVREVPKCRPLG